MSLKEFYKNKVVIITGSSMGIGKEIAHQVLLNDGKVVITGRNFQRLESVKNEFSFWSHNVLIHQGDVTDYSNNVELVKKTMNRFGRIDILINNAGLSGYGEVDKMKAEIAKRIIDTNIYGSLFPVVAALPEIKKFGGAILFISSIAGFYGLPEYSAYSMSKMALKALAQSLSIELCLTGINVCISFVGFTENDEDKKTLTSQGVWESVPKRPMNVLTSKQKTALKILKQIYKKKFSYTHSHIGSLTAFMSRFFPKITALLLKLYYNRKTYVAHDSHFKQYESNCSRDFQKSNT